MSTDKDIKFVELNKKWGEIDERYDWEEIEELGLDLDSKSTLVIIAHGNSNFIGNKEPGSIDISAKRFLQFINQNMANLSEPKSIYISTCGDGLAEYAARVRIIADEQNSLKETAIYGHSLKVTGDVPPPGTLDWFEIFTDEQQNIENDNILANTNDEKTKDSPKPWPATSILPPSSELQKYNLPTPKHYVFNETGNIMLSSTQPMTSNMDQSAMDLFEEVAVFFAAMTKAITSTTKPGTKPPYTPTDYYTIYDYVALENIVNRSGLFVNVHREDLTYSMQSGSISINVQFVEACLGVVLTDGVGSGALLASLKAMGKQATFSYNRTKKYQKIGNLLFVCEYLLGLPIVSVLYFYLDEEQTETIVKASPCFTATSENTDLKIHKDTFLFVVPSWIRKYASDLSSIDQDIDYKKLINELESFISSNPIVLSLLNPPTNNTLTEGTTYTVSGVNFGIQPGKLLINGTEQTIKSTGSGKNIEYAWTSTVISFIAKLGQGQSTTTGPIVVEIYAETPLVSSSIEDFTIIKQQP